MVNIIAGILIGIVNDTWVARSIIPFGWGVIWCVNLWIRQDNLKSSLEHAKKRNSTPKWGMSHTQAFYFIEFSTAVFTSLICSLLSGLIRDLLF